MTKRERLPRSEAELEELATYYGETDTAEEMDRDGVWVEPPMVTTSLRLPKPLMDAIRAKAGEQHIRHTALMRDILTAWFSSDQTQPSEIIDRLERIERLISEDRKAG
ncbi:BrnA antitoxin family protein [Kribbella sp. NBC_01245]|uniref:hypothetical protein n=1 Tax=Kribbella sp. NBC_01245 TaxID=2903578 RepID=UPI002E28BC62|nr:hypothetical protein [Kribbella sp. NBC_01245]